MENNITKNMIETMYSHKLNENFSGNSVEPNEIDRKEELEKFSSQITSRVEITTFNIYPDTSNVVFGGKFTDIENFSFEFTLTETDGVYITSEHTKLTDDVLDRIKKLRGYYMNWAEEWAKKIVNEYKDK